MTKLEIMKAWHSTRKSSPTEFVEALAESNEELVGALNKVAKFKAQQRSDDFSCAGGVAKAALTEHKERMEKLK